MIWYIVKRKPRKRAPPDTSNNKAFTKIVFRKNVVCLLTKQKVYLMHANFVACIFHRIPIVVDNILWNHDIRVYIICFHPEYVKILM